MSLYFRHKYTRVLNNIQGNDKHLYRRNILPYQYCNTWNVSILVYIQSNYLQEISMIIDSVEQ